ncbi:MAG: tripartite tricarboxylate transporter substrate binding protein [Bradyrhizobium sp.]|nr:tripartite tricarboxylate transporter substrate binding protein [Bradyrhizobium sp.]
MAAAGLCLSASTLALAQQAQQAYPDRPIKIIVPFPAGGALDTLARVVAYKLSSRWDKPVVVENRPGATGNIGAEAVAKAEPDGYTLLVAPPPPLAVNQYLFDNLRFDPSAFVPVTVIASAPNVLVGRTGLRAGSLRELIALAKAEPGTLTYGSTGKGGTPHLSAEILKSLAGIDLLHVAYKNPPQIMNDMLGGSVDLTFANLIDAMPLIEAGKLKAFAVGSATRSPLLPSVPALVETLPGFVSTTWYAMAAPPKTPHWIAEKLHSAIAAALREPETMAKLQALKAVPVLNTPLEAAAFITEDSARWRKVIVAAGIKADQ